MRKYFAYTLVELLISLAIFALLTALAVPAFSRYSANTDFKQKADEVKELMNQTYISSLNPENRDITLYSLNFFKSKIQLVSITGTGQKVVREVVLNENAAFIDPQGGTSEQIPGMYYWCSTDLESNIGCMIQPSSFEIIDANVKSGDNKVVFTTSKNPFRVELKYSRVN
jgi:prepilin-type N-terminal cleavage/methylation domain-containing protein